MRKYGQAVYKVTLVGGPYSGETIKMFNPLSGTLRIKVGDWVGRYVPINAKNLEWDGTIRKVDEERIYEYKLGRPWTIGQEPKDNDHRVGDTCPESEEGYKC